MYNFDKVDIGQLSQWDVDAIERLVVRLYNARRVDIYAIRSKWDPEGYARAQKKQKIPEGTRWQVFWRDGYTCVYCFAQGCSLTLDHLTPECEGGTFDRDNLVTCCHSCNQKKADLPIKEFVEDIWLERKQLPNRLRLSITELRRLEIRLKNLVEQGISEITGGVFLVDDTGCRSSPGQ